MMQLLILMTIILRIHLILKIAGQTGNNGTKNVEIMVPLKYVK